MNLNLKNKFAVLAGSALITATVLSGAAFAATDSTTADSAAAAAPAATAPVKADRLNLEQAVDGTLTQAQADILTQLGALRTAAREKVQADAKAVLDQAVAEGKLTQEEADELLSFKGHGGGKGRGGAGRHGSGR
ncbi:MAG: hypothetical protein K0R39_1408 [Symbiobacteriaceae bacterium]|jgi:hypothetical protein|nr:hypothetical protein [Symbiobacteriaceae bacterium]